LSRIGTPAGPIHPIFQLARLFEDNFPAATLTCGHLNRFCLDRTAYNRSTKVHQNALGRVRCGGYPFGPCKVFGKSAIMRPLRSITRPALALGCRVGKQSNDNGVRPGLRGCLRRWAGKSSSDGDVPKVCETANADLSNVFQICSSTAFG
jgi:hypothetical protein